jgi:hypothetical protein
MKLLNRILFLRYSKKDNMKNPDFKLAVLVLALLFMFSGCAMLGIKKDKGILLPESTKIRDGEDQLQPGLSVIYFHGFYRNISQMPRGKRAIEKGIPGKPIPVLDHKFGEDIVFDSGRAKGVGMHLDGFILFDKAGDYVFQANTNDGFRLLISGIKIIDDPMYHSDRMSGEVKVKVSEPGWYPLRILYFQRKGTATIQLFWKKPGDKTMVIVPAEAYAHIPTQN